MDKLLSLLQEKGILKPGGRVLCFTDGCAAQYRSATSLYFMVYLSAKYNCIIDRGISCAGHGKSSVDAINGVDKNTIHRMLMRSVQSADDAAEGKSKSLQVQTFNNNTGKKYSAAADCKRVLEEDMKIKETSTGIKYESMQRNKEINQRYWHVRGIDEELSKIRCSTVKMPEKGVTFKDMYHYYACPDLGANEMKMKVALRRIPCSCQACDEMIRKPWVHGKPANEQPRFQDVMDCYLRPILEDSNRWYIVDLMRLKPTDEEEAEEMEESEEKLNRGVLHNMTVYMGSKVKVGEVGAVACGNDRKEAKEGYYLVRFTSLPYPDQSGSGELKVMANWVVALKGARYWFYEPINKEEEVNLMHVVGTGIVLNDISPLNLPPAGLRKLALDLKAKKINDDDHNKVIDMIHNRDRFEYDPSRADDGDEEPNYFDFESNSDSEDE